MLQMAATLFIPLPGRTSLAGRRWTLCAADSQQQGVRSLITNVICTRGLSQKAEAPTDCRRSLQVIL